MAHEYLAEVDTSYSETAPVLAWVDSHPEELDDQNSIRVFVTGHMVDRPGRAEERLPERNIGNATHVVWEKLNAIYKEATRAKRNVDLVFCSGTAGMDLIALQWALVMMSYIEFAQAKDPTVILPRVTVRAYLPYNAESFITDAVAYGSYAEEWLNIFKQLQARGLVIEPIYAREDYNQQFSLSRSDIEQRMEERYGPERKTAEYDELNDEMISLLREGDRVLALWDGKNPDANGGTLDALIKALHRIKDSNNIEFIEDPNGTILPNMDRTVNMIDLLLDRYARRYGTMTFPHEPGNGDGDAP